MASRYTTNDFAWLNIFVATAPVPIMAPSPIVTIDNMDESLYMY